MDHFVASKIATKLSLHHKAMFGNVVLFCSVWMITIPNVFIAAYYLLTAFPIRMLWAITWASPLSVKAKAFAPTFNT
jgi:hypothetical protein